MKLPLLVDRIKKLKHMNRTHLMLAGLFGVLLLVIALPGGEKKQEDSGTIAETVQKEQEVNTVVSYQGELEQRLTETLRAMEGVGNVKVMITMKDNGENQVEKDMARSQEAEAESYTEETVFVQEESYSQSPYVKKVINPQVEGVLVVAQGGGNSTVIKNISEAVLALFPVEAHKIKVVKMN